MLRYLHRGNQHRSTLPCLLIDLQLHSLYREFAVDATTPSTREAPIDIHTLRSTVQHGRINQALRQHKQYLKQGGRPSASVIAELITRLSKHAPSHVKDIEQLYQLSKNPSTTGRLRLDTYSTILQSLSKVQSEAPIPDEYASKAKDVFESAMKLHGSSDLLSNSKDSQFTPRRALFLYHAYLNVVARTGQPDKVLAIYNQMRQAGVATTEVTFSIIFKSIAVAADKIVAQHSTAEHDITRLELENFPIEGQKQLERLRNLAMDVMNDLIPASGHIPGAASWNGLLAALGASHATVDDCYAQWTRMIEAQVQPDVHTERTLAKAFQDYPSLAADILAEARGMQTKKITSTSGGDGGSIQSRTKNAANNIKGLKKIHQAADSRQKAIALTDPITHLNLNSPLVMAHFGATAWSNNKEVRNADILFIDLHGHSVPAARAAIMHRLLVLVQGKSVIPPPMNSSRKDKGSQTNQEQLDDYEQQRKREPKGLILVTGIGGKGAPLKPAVMELFKSYNLPVVPTDNPGRLLVPYRPLYEFICREHEDMQRGRLFGWLSERYFWLGAGVLSVGVGVSLYSRLGPWLQ